MNEGATRVLTFSVVAEAVTGAALLSAPAFVGRLLLGEELAGVSALVARCFGVTLIALGVGCWPGARSMDGLTAARRGMLLYNAGIAIVLAYAGVGEHLAGPLLWPAVGLHAVVALLLGFLPRRS